MKFLDWLYLKAHGICPKHFVYKSKMSGCLMCAEECRRKRDARIKRIRESK